MKNRLYLLVSVSLLLLPIMPGLSSFPARATTQTGSRFDKPAFSSSQIPTDSQGLVTAIFELQSDPVIIHQNSQGLHRAGSGKVDLQSSEVLQYEARLETEQKDFESRAVSVSADIRVLAELRKLANAVALQAPASAISLISSLPAVKRVELSKRYHAVLDKSVPLIGAPAVWSVVDGGPSAGKGVKIAIIDSGIDITNPLFSDTGFAAPAGFPRGDPSFTNKKVIVAKAFSDSLSSPADEFGHGTSVAGIAAGDFNTNSP